MEGFLSRQRFAVWGLGRSGVAAANLLARRGKSVVASDPGSEEQLADFLEALDPRVEVRLGNNELAGAEVVVASPGLKPSLPIFADLPDDVPVISEIELAWEASPAPFVGITGTDGKTTTTMLAGEMLRAGGHEVVVAGNIGTPLCEVVEGLSAQAWVVAEVSAFQLWSIHRFRTRAAAFTNIAEDHLDYFVGNDAFGAYARAKRRLVRNSQADDLAAFNWRDAVLRGWGETFAGRRAFYSTVGEPQVEAELRIWLDEAGGALKAVDAAGDQGAVFETARLEAAGLRGHHNFENVMAAASLAYAIGVDWSAVAEAAYRFELPHHRLEYVETIEGVPFFDDSKATNAHAALAGLRGLNGELVVIAGGVDKGLDLGEFAREIADRSRAVILIGAVRERLAEALLAEGMETGRMRVAESMEDAVSQAYRCALPGATVVLSPACSSFDMFDSYAHRGEVFQAAVRALAKK